jgi:hypothetical protein
VSAPAGWDFRPDSESSRLNEEEPSMTTPSTIDPAMVRALAVMAELPLAEGRESTITPILSAWVRDANELSRKMSAAQHWTVTPATIFVHPLQPDGKA